MQQEAHPAPTAPDPSLPSRIMNRKNLACLLLLTALALPAPLAAFSWSFSLDLYSNNEDMFDRSDSPSGSETYNSNQNLDGETYGFTLRANPVIGGQQAFFAFSLRTGELDGTFDTTQIAGGSFTGAGRADFDRDTFEIEGGWFFTDIFFVRLSYLDNDREGEWFYDPTLSSGFAGIETYEDELWAFILGIGLDYPFYKDEAGKFLFGVTLFLGLVYGELEHTFVQANDGMGTITPINDSSQWEEFGLQVEGSLYGDIELNDIFSLFGEAGFSYFELEEDTLELTYEDLFVRIGVRGVY